MQLSSISKSLTDDALGSYGWPPSVKPTDQAPDKGYVQLQIRIEKWFRDALCTHFPAFSTHRYRAFFWRMAQYHIWGDFPDRLPDELGEDAEEQTRLVMPHEYVAEFVGVAPSNKDFSAIRFLQLFEENIWPLGVTENWSYVQGKARTISAELPIFVRDLLRQCRLDIPDNETVYFVTGKPYNRYKRDKQVEELRIRLNRQAEITPVDHPALPYIHYINEEMSQRMIYRLLRRNLPELNREYHALPEHTPQDRYKKRRVGAVLHTIRDFPELRYRGTWRSARIYPISLNVLSLPRSFRNLVFTGTTKFDVRSCQICIVAALWEVPRLKEFVAQPNSNIWKELSCHIGVELSLYKQVIKTAMFSIVFGMNAKKIRTTMLSNTNEGKLSSPLTEEQVDAFCSHPIVVDLLEARSKVLMQIKQEGGMRDCFGKWLPVIRSKNHHIDRDPCSVLSSYVQSVEMRLLLSTLPIFQNERSASLVATIHDGIVVQFTDKNEADRISRRIQNAVREEGKRMGMDIQMVLEDG